MAAPRPCGRLRERESRPYCTGGTLRPERPSRDTEDGGLAGAGLPHDLDAAGPRCPPTPPRPAGRLPQSGDLWRSRLAAAARPPGQVREPPQGHRPALPAGNGPAERNEATDSPPTPRLTFRESLSSRKSAVSLKTATGGALGTVAKMEAAMAAQTLRSGPLRSGSVRGARGAGGDAHLHRRGGAAAGRDQSARRARPRPPRQPTAAPPCPGRRARPMAAGSAPGDAKTPAPPMARRVPWPPPRSAWGQVRGPGWEGRAQQPPGVQSRHRECGARCWGTPAAAELGGGGPGVQCPVQYGVLQGMSCPRQRCPAAVLRVQCSWLQCSWLQCSGVQCSGSRHSPH